MCPNTSTKDYNSTCPTSDPHYKIINGICYYFETTELDYSDAKENCHKKAGKLFEPQNFDSNQDVFMAFSTVLGISGVRWIGINSLKDLGYRYDSNGQDLLFDIHQMWHAEDNQDSDAKCVVQVTFFRSNDFKSHCMY